MLSRFKLPVLLFVLLTSSVLKAQEVGVKLDFFGYVDNREFKAPYTLPKTILGTQLSPQLYIKLQENHYLYGGINYNQNFGKHAENKSRVNPIAYYNYQSDKIDFALGFIPRHERLKDVPRIVLADTFAYDRPNIEGMYFQYKGSNFKQAVFIDWLSQQSYTQREQFVVGITGHYDWGLLYFKNDGLLYHNALTSNDSIEEHIQDNGVITGRLGLDLSEKTFLDSLTIDAGAAVGFDRVRTEYGMRVRKGFISSQYFGYKNFGLENTLYLGEAINLPNGDPFYHRSNYDRLDLSWTPFKTGAIEGKFVASFHFAQGEVSNQQAFTLRYNFDQRLWKK